MSETLQSKLKPKELVDKYFVNTGSHHYVCTLCYPDWSMESSIVVKTYNAAAANGTLNTGNTCATQHLKAKHPDAFTEFPTTQSLLISPTAHHTYCWIDWIVSENRELDFCDKERVRRHTQNNLNPISTKTLKSRMLTIVEII